MVLDDASHHSLQAAANDHQAYSTVWEMMCTDTHREKNKHKNQTITVILAAIESQWFYDS